MTFINTTLSGDSYFPTVQILKSPISTIGFEDALRKVVSGQIKGGYCCLTNVHTVTESIYDAELAQALSASTYNFADGLPLVWAARLMGMPIASRVCGPDLMRETLLVTSHDCHVFLGGVSGTSEKIIQKFQLKQSISYAPPFRPFSKRAALEDWQKVKELLGEQKPKCVWVGLGAPKQEKWMKVVSEAHPDILFFGVGAAFDFLAGNKKRAPLFLQKIGMEWAFRLYQEPKRLWKRYGVTNTLFLVYFTKQLVKKKFRFDY